MSRRKLLTTLAVAVLVLGGTIVLSRPSNRVTRENFDRVGADLSLAEVEGILGPANCDKSDYQDFFLKRFGDGVPYRSEPCESKLCPGALDGEIEGHYWRGPSGMMEVAFLGGVTLNKTWMPRLSLIDRIKWQSRRWFANWG
jgi:hypothetical protein